ncbi:MAG: N-acetylmuramoyl-L-alanine amidase [Planctomycetes bacterium]|nr:N-acetylmuramoyl-L-alanine amidase [Planctomycetota bacterium]
MFLATRFILAGLLAVGGDDSGSSDIDRIVRRFELTHTTDVLSGREMLRGPGLALAVAPGLAVAVINGETRYLSTPVQVSGGRIVFPAELVALIERRAKSRAEPAVRAPATPRGNPIGRPFKVVVDAGHGGVHTGGKAASGLMEKDVALDVSLRLQRLLEAMGVQVIMTRTTDRHFSEDTDEDLLHRVAVSNRAAPDLFISIHSNWHWTPDPRGFEVYVARGLEFGRSGSRRLAAEIRSLFRSNLNTEDRGIKEAGFKVIKLTEAPAVLVELEFISNPEGERELADPAHRQKLAELLAEAIRKYAVRG